MTSGQLDDPAMACVEAFYGALIRRDVEALRGLLTPRTSWRLPNAPTRDGRLRGRGSVLSWLKVPPPGGYAMRVDAVEARGAGRVAIYGVHDHHLPDGRHVAVSFVHVVQVRRGRIATLEERLDCDPRVALWGD